MRTDRSVDFPDITPAERSIGVRHFDDGVSQSGREANDLFLATDDGRFEKVSLVSGLDGRADGRSFALLDFDRDGWLDIVTVNANEPYLELHRNRMALLAPQRGFIAVDFVGGQRAGAPEAGWSNRSGVGARIEVEAGGATLVRALQAGEGLAAQNTSRLLIGLGENERADRVHVRWPGGRAQSLLDVPAGSLIHFDERGEIGVSPYVMPQVASTSRLLERTGARLPIAAAATDAVHDETRPRLHLFTTMATWCEACREEIPELAWLEAKLGAALAIHGVATDPSDTASGLAKWMTEHHPPYPLISAFGDDAQRTLVDAIAEQVREVLRKEAFPATVLTDATGRVLHVQWGPPTVSQLGRWIEKEEEGKRPMAESAEGTATR